MTSSGLSQDQPTLFAHSLSDAPKAQWETLACHSDNVARRAGLNAAAFDAAICATISGLLHDLGKAKPAFQARLSGANIRVSHSGEGARAAIEQCGQGLGKLMAYVIAGHHAGLANGIGRGDGLQPSTPLDKRLDEAERLDLPEWLTLPALKIPGPLQTPGDDPGFALHFFTRMLFSALVDADFIETERFYAPGMRRPHSPPLTALRDALDERLARFGPPQTEVNRLRAEVLQGAREAAASPPGVFSLTVPTGGGKTLSSLKFALDHAICHGKRRVIHVAPFSAIIDQNAAVFRDVLGDADAVLEHHTGFDAREIMDETRAEATRLAAQNWDRPVVVTTAVQFFESLFANRTQKCRKLHNIAGSVIVLDEAQSLPLPFLRGCLAALGELVRGYGCSVVLCTATQPAVHKQDGLKCPEALDRAATSEIAPDPARLYKVLKRVTVERVGYLDNAALADRVRGRSALVIVNNKRQARMLFDMLRGEGVFHLSTHMTARHRRHVLGVIRARLADHLPCLVLSTALVEAGVDLDFPEVWRAVAGLDSIAQAAGRCNREGLQAGGGRVFVFEPDKDFAPPPELARNADVAAIVLADYPDDPLQPGAITAYFSRLYHDWGAALDAKELMQRIKLGAGSLDFPFASIAHDFRMIEDFTVPLIIGDGRFGMDAETQRKLAHSEHAGALARALQPFTVQISPKLRDKLVGLGAAEVVRPEDFEDQFVVLRNPRLYDEQAGFCEAEPEDLGDLLM